MIRLLIAGILLALAGHAQPARIVSTSPSITETLFALDLGERVVGVSNYCRYPSAVLSLPKVGTYLKPDPEKIALLRPDLVIIHKSPSPLAGRLTVLGIKYAEVKVGALAEVYAMIDDIGRAAGVPAKSEKLNRDIRSRLEAFRVEVRNHPRPKVLILIGRDPGLLTDLVAAGPGTYLGELLEIAGGSNVLTESAIAYPHISMETVVRLNPGVILDSSNMGDPGADPAPQEARLREPWLSHRELSAVQEGKVLGLAAQSLVTPGPRVVDAVELIRVKIRPKEVRQ